MQNTNLIFEEYFKRVCLIAAPIGGLCYDILGDFKLSLIVASVFAGIAMASHLVLSNSKNKITATVLPYNKNAI